MNIESFIWGICDDVLRGLFKQHEYGDVILPFLVLRRLDCVQEEHKDEVVKLYNELKDKFDDPSDIIHTKLGLNFSNHSRYDLRRLVNEPSKLNENLYEYLRSFSPNVQDIVQNFGLQKHIDKLEENDSLYILVEKFSEVDLHPSKVDNHLMGSIFEELLRKFSEMSNETSGEHYTPRDIVSLLVSLVFSPEIDKLSKPNRIVSLYDPCCGTGGMLTVGKDWIQENISKDIEVNMFGQELNPQTYSICKSDFLITNEQPENIKLGNTLSKDGYQDSNRKFDYMICNPPYGVSWKKDAKQVKNESKESDGRFSAGTPRTSDGQLLFLQHMISKMEPGGSRIGIVFNGSPMFTGDAGSGESEIRRWIIENDLLETIVQLPNDMFFNTSITTYIWIVTNKKSSERKGKIQLINGSSFYKQMKKLLNKKRNIIEDSHKDEILQIYKKFEENKFSQIFDNDSFGYTKITIEQPAVKNGKEVRDKKGNLKPETKLRDYEKLQFSEDIDEYFYREVKPHLPNSWIDYDKNIKGYQINFIKYFHQQKISRPSKDIAFDLSELDKESENLLRKIDSLVKKYDSYKDSGNERIGEVPINWDIKKNKYFTQPHNNKSEKGEEELLSVSEHQGVIPRSNIREKEEHLSRSESLAGYKKVKKGELVSNIMLAWKRGLGVSKYDGIVSPAYSVFSFLNSEPKYFHYLFRTDEYISEFKRNSTGVIESRLRLYDDEFGAIKSHFPPQSEQKKIFEYLDEKTQLIDRAVSIEEKRIELLKEYKKSLIHEVATGKKKVI
jgi:type I restriction enzyme M protein